jgi:flagellum-specific ATP synthase
VTAPPHRKKARELRELLAAYAAAEDLIRLGAYLPGSDAVLDRAVRVMPRLNEFLRQDKNDSAGLAETVARLLTME